MESTKWCVVTYQIPVPMGDCSIHVRHFGKEKVAAILMDGGTNAEASDRIDQAWKEVKADLGITNLKLSGWVVTHWDGDHYKGGLTWLTKLATEVLADDWFLLAGHPRGGDINISLGVKPFREVTGDTLAGFDLFTGKKADEGEKERPIFRCLAAGGSAVTNKNSILAVIYWPKEKRCSLYTGGDGNPESAKECFNDLFEHQAHPNSGRRVKAMKLDHHGSTLEFNKHLGDPEFEGYDKARETNLTTFLLPRYILVTPGPMYGHPSWDLVYFLYLFYNGLSDIKPNEGYDKKTILYSTRSPTWNIQQGHATNKLHFDKLSIKRAGDAYDYVKMLLEKAKAAKMEHLELPIENYKLKNYLEAAEKDGKISKTTVDDLLKEIKNDLLEEDKNDLLKNDEKARSALATIASEWWNWLSPMTVNEFSHDFYLIAFTSYADETKEEAPRRKKMGTVSCQTDKPQVVTDSEWES